MKLTSQNTLRAFQVLLIVKCLTSGADLNTLAVAFLGLSFVLYRSGE